MKARALGDVVQADLLTGWRDTDGRHVAALRLRLAPGWKTYWRAPGDVGLPPEFDWRASTNLSGVKIIWPTPHRFDQDGVMTIGYKDELILPLSVAATRPGQDIALRGALDLGVCSDVCVPVRLNVAADLPRGASKRDPRIAAALAARPYSAHEAGVQNLKCGLRPDADGGLDLHAEITLPRIAADELVVVETDNPKLWVAPSTVRRSGATLIADTEIVHVEGRAFGLNRSGLRLTVLGDGKAVDIQGCPAE